MKKQTFIRIALFAMIALNIVLFTLFMLAPERHDGDRPKRIIIKELHLNDAQVAKYEKLIYRHRNAIGRLDSEMRAAKRALYNTLGTKADSTEIHRLLEKTGAIQDQIERTHYTHFEEIRALLRPDQVTYFNSLKVRLGKIFGPPHPPKK